MSRILHIFWDVDMRCGHHGLNDIARKEKKSVDTLKPGDFLCFINANQDKIKVLAPIEGEENTLGVLGSYRSPKGRIGMAALQYIPHAFGDAGFNMNRAIKAALVSKLKRKEKKKGEEKTQTKHKETASHASA